LSQLLSKVTVTHCSFYIKCSIVCLVAGRRTLKMCCYRSRLVFNCCFKTLVFHKVV